MPVDSKHPAYTDHVLEWEQMRDTERGALRIKEKGSLYLPVPSGFTSQPDGGTAMYGAYMNRARFPDYVAPTVRGMTGLIHRKESVIEMPPAMEPLREKCTKEGLTLDSFHMNITQELLRVGRFGILADAAIEGSDVPFLAGYNAETIINWDDEGSFFVLDETALVRTGFDWKPQKQFRVLEMVNGTYTVKVYLNETSDQASANQTINPAARGNGALEQVPFVVASPNEIATRIGEIPLIGVARASIACYQLDADYRHQLFMSGQETFVVTGAEKAPDIVGASVRLSFENENAQAYYVGPAGVGIAAHQLAIQDAKEDAVHSGAQLFDTKQSGVESGEALRLRYGAQSATMTTIAVNSARALEKALRNIALFMALDPEKVVVKPNLQFIDVVMEPAQAEALMRLWMGAAISKQTMFENFKKGEIVPEERTFEEEEELIEVDEIDRAAKADEEMEREKELNESKSPAEKEEDAKVEEEE